MGESKCSDMLVTTLPFMNAMQRCIKIQEQSHNHQKNLVGIDMTVSSTQFSFSVCCDHFQIWKQCLECPEIGNYLIFVLFITTKIVWCQWTIYTKTF